MATAPFGVPFACGAILGGVIGCGVLLLPGMAPAPAAAPLADRSGGPTVPGSSRHLAERETGRQLHFSKLLPEHTAREGFHHFLRLRVLLE